jgi:hypothetical protein
MILFYNKFKENYYSFLYWRQSPRGNVKFGITHLPWERLRMQQQGTDENIQFDHIWMIKSYYPSFVSMLESRLKDQFKNQCLHNKTNRAGHTEWYQDINLKDFKQCLLESVVYLTDGNSFKGQAKKIRLKKPYNATKSSECPFGSPSNSRHQSKYDINEWASGFWDKVPESLLLVSK